MMNPGNMGRMAVIATLFLACASGYAAAPPSEFSVVEHPISEADIDIGKEGDSLGDLLVFRNPLFDAENKVEIGHDSGSCTRTVVGKEWYCTFTNELEGGQITVSGTFHDTGDSVFTVIGGTGRFAGRYGEMQLHFHDTKRSAYDFTFKLNK
jgi:hypothetical protein